VLFRIVLMLVVTFFAAGLVHAAPADFDSAKRMAARIYADENTDFYCDCPIQWNSGKGRIDLKSCGYQIRKNGPRAQRVEWEHVVPAQQFGASRACWKKGGREHCGDTDQKFRQIEADLFNLRPALGEVNGDRAHFRFAELPNVQPQHGACPIRIDFSRQLAEPRAEVRGDIARIYFYMADRYQLALSAAEEKLFLRWHTEDPVSAREMALMRRTAQLMGHSNDFVTGEKRWYPGYLSAQPEVSDAEPVASTHRIDAAPQTSQSTAVVGNKNSKKYHLPHCSGYSQIKRENQQPFATEAQAIAAGFQLAGNCKK
jgi:deoxyribonuclease-1